MVNHPAGKPLRLYHVEVIGAERYGKPFAAMSAGKARYRAYLALRDVWPDIKLTDLRVYSLGLA